jgi:PAS domain S-box-containing protein
MQYKNKDCTILIVDDNQENLRVLKTYLNNEGYKVLIASNGADALERAKRNTPLIILLDIKMPGMDGFEVCAKIKHDTKLKKIPILFVTAASDAESIAQGFSAGGSDYITKPINKLELLARVKNHIKIANINRYLEQKVAGKTLELQKSEERFKLAMEASQDGIFDWNLITNEIYYSPTWKSMLGYKYHELPNNISVWEKLSCNKCYKLFLAKQQKLIAKEIGRLEVELKMKHKNGQWVDILTRAECFFDEKRKAIRMVGTHIDITERKRFELLIKEKNIELELSK